MCGITGYIGKKHYSDTIIEKMLHTLKSRGPDGYGIDSWQSDGCQVAFGHRRLSIIDLSDNAKQPMSYDELHIVFNGEIYNYQEVKNELISLGHFFKTSSDTEVILHSIREWGLEAIQRWHGMFSIVLFDEREHTITAIRDRAGVKPFFYFQNSDIFIFGSELKAILAHPEFKKEIDINALASYFQYGYVSWPKTIWQNTHKLPPGHFLQMDIGSGEVRQQQYWNVYSSYLEPKLNISFHEAITGTESVLKKAIDYRMVADVPVGVFLSGGYDSSCVVAMLQNDRTERIKTFTIGILDSQMDEAPFAKKIADYLGTDHTEYYCTPKEVLDIFPQLPDYYDEPFADSSCIPTILVSRLARKSVTVALSADAGDEIFAGYDRYQNLIRYYSKINTIPSVIRSIGSGIMNIVPAEFIPFFGNKFGFVNKYKKLKNQLKNHSLQGMMYNLTFIYTDSEINELFAIPIKKIQTPHDNESLLHDDSKALQYLMALDYQSYLPDDILQKVDRATMSCSLEGREPFLDHSVIEWGARLPDDYKYYNGERKYILKQLVHKYIPKEMMDRKKMGFSIPISKLLSQELKELLVSYLSEDMLRKHGLFNVHYVTELLREFIGGKEGHYLKLWHILIFQMWYEKWMENS
jgi:asparagine synthase (glutamine-hydrolysing)